MVVGSYNWQRRKERSWHERGDPSSLRWPLPPRSPLLFTFSTYFKENKTFPSPPSLYFLRVVIESRPRSVSRRRDTRHFPNISYLLIDIDDGFCLRTQCKVLLSSNSAGTKLHRARVTFLSITMKIGLTLKVRCVICKVRWILFVCRKPSSGFNR